MGTKVEPTVSRRATGQLVWVAIPCLVFLLHAALFRAWIVDDAGIAFAYARSLATGHGLVSQPGLPPVEGYSDPLWVFLIAVLYRLHLFTAFVTPKLLSFLLVIACFALCARMLMRRAGASGPTTAVALTLLALNTPFVVWTTSGLENPLYVFLLAAFACCALQAVTAPRPPRLQAAVLGLLATALALTRPEGVLYAAAFPTLLLASRAYPQHRGATPLAPLLLVYAVTFAVTFGAFLLFRYHYFGELLPNTYYAKGTAYFAGARYNRMGAPPLIWRLLDLLYGFGGWAGFALPVWLPIAVWRALRRRRLEITRAALGVMLAFSLLIYFLLPPDWMKEYRFATASFLFLDLFSVLVTLDFITSRRAAPGPRRLVAATLAALVLAWSGWVFSGRSLAFLRAPEVDFAGVKGWISDRLDWYADMLGVAHGSALAPDLGATLWYSRLRIYDLAKLCDKTIGRTLLHDQPAFYHYVFAVAKPTFIHTHGNWSHYAGLDGDPRFRRDYLPIWEEQLDGWGETYPVFAGDYVRKDAVRGKEAALEQVRREGWWR